MSGYTSMTDPERTEAIRPEAARAAAEATARGRYNDAVNGKIRNINSQLSVCCKYPHEVYLCQSNEAKPFARDVAEAFEKAGWVATVRDDGQVYVVLDVPRTVPSAGPYR